MRHLTTPLVALAMTPLASATVFAVEQTQPYTGPWPGWHAHWSGFWWICPLIMLFMFGFFAVLFFALRRNGGHWQPPWRWMSEQAESWQTEGRPPWALSESALDILNKRYAQGEIDKKEYEEKKTTITSTDK